MRFQTSKHQEIPSKYCGVLKLSIASPNVVQIVRAPRLVWDRNYLHNFFLTPTFPTFHNKLQVQFLATMKRKLNEMDAPEASSEKTTEPTNPAPAPELSFRSLGLDDRLVKAAAHERFRAPTPVQARAIPLILRGEHVLARARTGSGKTAAYCLPMLQSILTAPPAGEKA